MTGLQFGKSFDTAALLLGEREFNLLRSGRSAKLMFPHESLIVIGCRALSGKASKVQTSTPYSGRWIAGSGTALPFRLCQIARAYSTEAGVELALEPSICAY